MGFFYFLSPNCIEKIKLTWHKKKWDDDEVRFVLDKHALLDFYSASSLKQQSVGKHVAPLKTHYPDLLFLLNDVAPFGNIILICYFSNWYLLILR
jgi:hypothetical protein